MIIAIYFAFAADITCNFGDGSALRSKFCKLLEDIDRRLCFLSMKLNLVQSIVKVCKVFVRSCKVFVKFVNVCTLCTVLIDLL